MDAGDTETQPVKNRSKAVLVHSRFISKTSIDPRGGRGENCHGYTKLEDLYCWPYT
jgi:hypothetical protein